jgi:hypothetical protein
MANYRTFYLDCAKISWQEFVNVLKDIKSSEVHTEAFFQIRPPARCVAEARRVIRDMELDDHVELLVQNSRGLASLAARLRRRARPGRAFYSWSGPGSSTPRKGGPESRASTMDGAAAIVTR